MDTPNVSWSVTQSSCLIPPSRKKQRASNASRVCSSVCEQAIRVWFVQAMPPGFDGGGVLRLDKSSYPSGVFGTQLQVCEEMLKKTVSATAGTQVSPMSPQSVRICSKAFATAAINNDQVIQQDEIPADMQALLSVKANKPQSPCACSTPISSSAPSLARLVFVSARPRKPR
jgi:hypothetical protein